MKRVLKWSVPVDDQDHPVGSGRVLMVECQHRADVVEVWTEETTHTEGIYRRVRVYRTGHEVPEGDEWLGSTMTQGRNLVWHVFGSLA